MQTAVRSDDTTMDGNEALTFVEGLAEKVAGHDYTLSKEEKNAIDSIKKFIERMLEDIVVQRNEDQDEVDNIKNLIEGCATSATESLEKVAALNKAVGTARTQQSDCRVSEGKAKDEMSAACAAYDAYCQGPGSKVPDCLSSMTSDKMKSGDANTKKSVRSCLEEINVWFPPLWKMYTNCKKHEGIRADQTDVCNNDQNSFEGDFCQYSLLLTTTCDTQDDCRSKNIDARAKSHAAVKIAEKARASDCEVGHKVKCLLAIFEETDNKKKPGMLASCKSEKYTCPDGITYPEIPGPTPYTREPSNPCDDSWLQKEYKSKAWYDKAPAGKCIPCLSLKAEEAYFVEVSGACSAQESYNGVYKAMGTTADGRQYFKRQWSGDAKYLYFDANCDGKDSTPKWILDSHKPSTSLKADLDNDGDCHYGGRIGWDEPSKEVAMGTHKWKMYCGKSWQWLQLTVAEVKA